MHNSDGNVNTGCVVLLPTESSSLCCAIILAADDKLFQLLVDAHNSKKKVGYVIWQTVNHKYVTSKCMFEYSFFFNQ